MATPAALTVISAEDVQRSGARSIAEALRLVPGMYVGRINSSSWVIGARGLTGSTLTGVVQGFMRPGTARMSWSERPAE